MVKFDKIQNYQFIKKSHFSILVDVNLNDFVIFFNNDIIQYLSGEKFNSLIQRLKILKLKMS